MQKINKRQNEILGFVRQNPGAANQKIREFLEKNFDDVSRATVARDLSLLLKEKLIVAKGQGRNVKYLEKETNPLWRFVDSKIYFQKEDDARQIVFPKFNFEIFDLIGNIFDKKEIKKLNELNEIYLKKTKKIPSDIYKKELERLTIELAWKSSQIEGNTYSLLDTENLIKEKKEAPGHKKEEAIMILNHKHALDYIFKNQKKFKKINLRDIEDIHRLLITGLNIDFGLRKRMVGITGTGYKPLDNQYQIKEAVVKLIKTLNKIKEPFSKALIVLLLISYIQPFNDGNKRTARILSNAILIANAVCPLSYRSVDTTEYKKAIIIFYEQNSLVYFKKLFQEQFEFAIKNYF